MPVIFLSSSFNTHEQRFLLGFKHMILITMSAKYGGNAAHSWNKKPMLKLK